MKRGGSLHPARPDCWPPGEHQCSRAALASVQARFGGVGAGKLGWRQCRRTWVASTWSITGRHANQRPCQGPHCVGHEAALLTRKLQARRETIGADHLHLSGNQAISQLRQKGESLVPFILGAPAETSTVLCPVQNQNTCQSQMNGQWILRRTNLFGVHWKLLIAFHVGCWDKSKQTSIIKCCWLRHSKLT